MNIIGIHGLIGAGKDTLAKIMMDYLGSKGYTSKRIGFADALKSEIAYMLLDYENSEAMDAAPVEEVYKAVEEKVKWINEHKENFRLILQGWGTDFRRTLCGQDYWINRWKAQVMYALHDSDVKFVFCPDVRFANEFEIIKGMHGTMIHVIRDACVRSAHASEKAEFNGATFAYQVFNNHEIKDLEIQARILLNKMGY